MKTLVVDTHKVIQALQSRGFTAAQAEGITDTLKEIDLSELATKSDLKEELSSLEMRMVKWVFGMLIAQAALIVAIIELL